MCSSAHVEEFSATNLKSHEGLKFTCASGNWTFQNEPLLSLVPLHLGFKLIILFLFFSVPTDLFYRICKLSANLLIYNKILCFNMWSFVTLVIDSMLHMVEVGFQFY